MSKVILSQVQVEALDSLLEQANGNRILVLKWMGSHSQEKRLNKKFPSLKDLDITDVARALYLGYDDAPEFKAGEHLHTPTG